MQKPRVLAVAGATASGKSSLALFLAKQLNGEILCMDSMQIYRGMDIGTAKPTAQERAEVAHHLFDIVKPTQPFAVGDYATLAQQTILQVHGRGKLPILVGGTGLYLKALMHGLTLGGVKSDEAVRQKYIDISNAPNGKERLHKMLEAVDAPSAKRLHPNDVRRVIRALEVYELTGKTISEQTVDAYDCPFEIEPIALDMPREKLFLRIEARITQMMDAGLLNEVKGLLESGVPKDAQAMQGIGYKELVPVVEGKSSVQSAIWHMVQNTRHYAKRQGTWLRTESAVSWLDTEPPDLTGRALQEVEAFLAK